MRIEHEIKEEAYDTLTVQEAIEAKEFVDTVNYLAEEGFITIVEDKDGEPRFYSNCKGK